MNVIWGILVLGAIFGLVWFRSHIHDRAEADREARLERQRRSRGQ